MKISYIMKKFLIITVASHKIGFGHRNRAIILKKNLFKKKIYTKILLFDEKNYNKQILRLKSLNIDAFSNIILDICHPFVFKNFIANKIFKIIKDHHKITIIDDLSKSSLIKKKFPAKFVIFPYFFKKNIIKIYKNNYKLLFGPKYFITYKFTNLKFPKNKIKNILLTCGGSDNEQFSLFFINVFKKMKNFSSLNFKILLGPYFKKNLKKKISFLIKRNKNIQLVKYQKSINAIVDKSDFVITSSGLTKYELAIKRVNYCVFSANHNHFKLNSEFKKKKLSFDLGVPNKTSEISKKLFKFIKDIKRQKQHFKNMKKSIGLNGFQNIFDEISH